ncbi:hypothetical protein FisN_21Lh034 [Fistulifera solaris]|uniref:Glutaminyl-peptide cyclotransferase n=1 Tax=Fistulifera solaris TaxID=1519565 RepID=A0A1Z5KJX9_FISSO|nr:hypothetical protein FisN_21Lh034 [Fistulifera solaris]|eukprot:GAX26566.1 hypothetical protein FisN_21Lh034 [Fistulifera solaris]
MPSPETEARLFHRRRKVIIGGVFCVAILASAIVSAVLISRNNDNASPITVDQESSNATTTSAPITTPPVSTDDSSPISTAPTFTPTIAKISSEPDVTRRGTFELLETVPHDPDAFTQGLVIVARDNNQHELYEGTGLYGESDVRRIDIMTGNVLLQTKLSDSYFGEGITYYETESGEARIVQLTWQEGVAFVYDSQTLQPISNITFSTTRNEGWGITGREKDGNKMFVVSDGSSYLHFWNQSDFVEFRRVQVTSRESLEDDPNAVNNLNELEWDPTTDTILANVWYSDTIQRIDPDTGLVTVDYDLSTLYPNRDVTSDVLNGIALVPDTSDEYWVTGKLWPNMFRIRLIDEPI